MDVIGVDKEKGIIPYGLEKSLVEVITIEEIPEHIQDVDYLIFALPALKIEPILNHNLLQKFKKGIVIVNVGRGNIIDEEVLCQGIRERIIDGAALDVWNHEPLEENASVYHDSFLRERILSYCHKAVCHELQMEDRIKCFHSVIKALNQGKIACEVDLFQGY